MSALVARGERLLVITYRRIACLLRLLEKGGVCVTCLLGRLEHRPYGPIEGPRRYVFLQLAFS